MTPGPSIEEKTKSLDAVLGSAIQAIEELEALVAMVSGLTAEKKRPALISDTLREIAALIDRLPLLANDLHTIKKLLRTLLSTDPEQTPRAFNLRPGPPPPDTTFSPVEDKQRAFRGQTKPGFGPPPLPKKP